MPPPKFSYATSDFPYDESGTIWSDVLAQTNVSGRIVRESEKDSRASVSTYAFGPTTVSFWTMHRMHHERTRRDCTQKPIGDYAVIYVQEGSSELTQDERTVVIHPGDCIIINLEEPFSHSHTVSLRFIALHIPAGMVRCLIPSPEKISVTLLPKESDWVKALSAAMATLTPKRVDQPSFMQKIFFSHICSLLSLAIDPTEQLLKTHKSSMLHRFRISMRQHFHEPDFSPSKLAEEMKISTRTLYSIFSNAKSSFGHELLFTRIEQACRLLSDPRFDIKTMAEISQLIGFSRPSHFTTRFNKAMGMTPSAFRAKRQNNEQKPAHKTSV
ncbi:MAG: AraC family transcriptional regulator [Bdellovibrionales bacterium]